MRSLKLTYTFELGAESLTSVRTFTHLALSSLELFLSINSHISIINEFLKSIPLGSSC